MSAQKRKLSINQQFQSPKVKTPKIEKIFPTPDKTPQNKKSPKNFSQNSANKSFNKQTGSPKQNFEKLGNNRTPKNQTPKNFNRKFNTPGNKSFNKNTPNQSGSPNRKFEKPGNRTTPNIVKQNVNTPGFKKQAGFAKTELEIFGGAANTPGSEKPFIKKTPNQAGSPQPKLEMFAGTVKLLTEKEKIKAAAEKLTDERKDNRHTRRRGLAKEKRLAKRNQFNDLKRQALQGETSAKNQIQLRIAKLEGEGILSKNKTRRLNTLKRIINFDPSKNLVKATQNKQIKNRALIVTNNKNQKPKVVQPVVKHKIAKSLLNEDKEDSDSEDEEMAEDSENDAEDSDEESGDADGTLVSVENEKSDDEEGSEEEEEGSEVEEEGSEEEEEGSDEEEGDSGEEAVGSENAEEKEYEEEASDSDGEEEAASSEMEKEEGSEEEKEDSNTKIIGGNKPFQVNKNQQPTSQNKPTTSPGGGPVKKTRFVVFVGNIPYTTTTDNLRQHFNKVGEIVDVRIPMRPDGKSRGIAYVEVKDESSYQKALSMHNSFMGGRKINVLYTEAGKKKTDQQKADIKAKNFKFQAMKKQGQLQGSENYNQKRSVRRAKNKPKDE